MVPGLPRNLGSLVVLALLIVAGGCHGSAMDAGAEQHIRPGSTYLVHLPGIAGDTIFDRNWMGALKDGGAADAVELFDWTCNDGGIAALQAYDRNRREAARLARHITSRAKADPTGHIVLTAESGGVAVAVWAIERLPRDVKLDQVILVAPALSPTYDLSKALRHVDGRMTYFSSPGDWFVLGFGTRVFGTSDGRNVEAAGYVGFRAPRGADGRQYHKLVAMRYDPAWMQWGDFGSHTGGLSPSFARHFIAPLLNSEARREHVVEAADRPIPAACASAGP